MLTDMASPVNKPELPAVGLWLSVTELAKARGISKPAVTQAIKRWAAQGIVVSTRRQDGSQRSVLVNVAEFDRARGETGDLSRLLGEQTKKGAYSAADPVYAREQARRAAYDADLALIKRDEALGRLVPTSEVERATILCAETAVRDCEQVAARSDDYAVKYGLPVAAARSMIKDVVHELRQRMADNFSRLPSLAMAPGIAAPSEDGSEQQQ